MRRLLLLLAGFLFSASALAETLYVQSLEAKLLQEPKFSAAVAAKLAQGTEVSVLATEGRWYKVSDGSSTGWLSKFLLAEHPPLKKITVLEASEEGLDSENVRRRASAVTTAGAARGLASDDRRRAQDDSADYSALREMEEYSLKETEVSQFLREGLRQ